MKTLTFVLAFVATVLIATMVDALWIRTDGPYAAEIVEVACEPQMGMPDCRTIVDIDGRRYSRAGDWGTVGDSIMVVVRRQAGDAGWRSP